MKYTISFRFTGGLVTAEILGKQIGRIPQYQRRSGDQILDRKGHKIGHVEKNFGSFPLEIGDICDDSLPATFEKFISIFEGASSTLNQMRVDGAKFDFYVVLESHNNCGEVFDPNLLGRLARLEAALSITFVLGKDNRIYAEPSDEGHLPRQHV